MKYPQVKIKRSIAQNGSGNHTYVTKRLLDVTLSVMLAPVAFVISLIFGLMFFLSTRENPIFIQERVGLHKKTFSLYKLRTLPQATRNIPTHELRVEDIPPIGKLMRKVKVDELPQLINVITGDMSLVGPRPCLPTQEELVSEREKYGIFDLRPGITGSAQVAGLDMSSVEDLILADVEYINIQNFGLDLRILIQTATGKGNGDRYGR